MHLKVNPNPNIVNSVEKYMNEYQEIVEYGTVGSRQMKRKLKIKRYNSKESINKIDYIAKTE